MSARAVRREIASLEDELAAVAQQLQEKRQALLQEHLDARAPVEQRRYELVAGVTRATDDELEGYTGPRTSGAIKPLPVPCFWLHALSAEPRVAQWIEPHDRPALELLRDVRLVRGAGGLMLEFHFEADDTNPYFDNMVLRRGLAVEKDAVTGLVTDVRDEGTVIEWKDGKSLLLQPAKAVGAQGVRRKKKKGAAQARGKPPGGKGKGAPPAQQSDEEDEPHEATQAAVKLRPAPSFFRFFTPLHRPKVIDPTALDADEDEVAQAALDDAYFMGDGPGGGAGRGSNEEDEDGEPVLEEEEDGVRHVQDPEARRCARAMKRKADRDMVLLDVIVRRVLPRAAVLYHQALQASAAAVEEEDDAGFTVVQLPRGPGSPPPTPAAVQQAVHALLRHNQHELDQLSLDFKAAKWRAAQEADAREHKLLDQRAALLSKAAGPIKLSRQVQPVAAAVTTSLPLFWLRVLRGCEGASDACVHRRDELALACLADVRARWDWVHMSTAAEPWRKATVEWTFLDNPYFPAGTLSKSYTFACDGGSANKLDLRQQGQVLAAPQWFSNVPGGMLPKQEDKLQPRLGSEPEGGGVAVGAQPELPQAGRPGRCDLTMGPPARSSKKHHGKPMPAQSFFNLFKEGCLRHAFNGLEGMPGSAQQDQEALAAEEALLGALLTGPLRYAAMQLCDQVEVDEEDLCHELNEFDEEDEHLGGEDDEDDEEGGEVEQDSGNEASHGKAPRARAGKRKAPMDSARPDSSGWGKYTVFVGLTLLVVFTQVFMWIDMFFLSRR